MAYEIITTGKFRKDLKLLAKRKYDLNKLKAVLKLLQNDQPIPEQYQDHQLRGNLQHFRELHISPDWLLIYLKDSNRMILTLSRTGTHADLFSK
ncbi:MAG: type II toxin-antitoxin system YafQ family toxin [Treponemataceae bacterium]|nr:type II toxin-antitoxin system YafQ family toxin [Treponemataceae bacterium]